MVDGASTYDIAAELYLSRRTVENHLHRVYHALHVNGRDELANLLRLPERPANWP